MQLEILRLELREKITIALKEKDGLTITDISKLLDIHPSTASKYLAVMKGTLDIFKNQETKTGLIDFKEKIEEQNNNLIRNDCQTIF